MCLCKIRIVTCPHTIHVSDTFSECTKPHGLYLRRVYSGRYQALPVFRITGTSMEPNLNDGDIIVAMKTDHFQRGQVCGFYFNNKLLLKRVIATAGMWVEIDDEGFVFVDGEKLEEPYVTDRSKGISDLEYPVQVPDGCVFVLGDHRSTSVDSRSSVLGFIQESETVGRIVLRVWPLEDFGLIE